MPRDVQRASARVVWPSLLALRRFLTGADLDDLAALDQVVLARFGAEWGFHPEPRVAGADELLIVGLTRGSVADDSGLVAEHAVARYDHDRFVAGEDPIVAERGALEPAVLTVLRMYLPSIVGGLRARRAGTVFVLAHLAQTLDGRIACHNGHSQWISNEANLHHAHRLRALHDAVLVGGQTVISDDPQLTVRHVEGDDPARIVLSASGAFLGTDRDYQVYGGAGCSVLCDQHRADELVLNGRHGKVTLVPVQSDERADEQDRRRIAPATIRAALAERGVHSVFVEGGGRTLSSFLEGTALDVLHVHIAPVVLGSGIPGFRLPEVNTIQAGRRMHMDSFALEGEVLFELRERREAAKDEGV